MSPSDEDAPPTVPIPLQMAGGELDAPVFQPVDPRVGSAQSVIVDLAALPRRRVVVRPRVAMGKLAK